MAMATGKQAESAPQLPARKRGGNPPFKPTKEHRNQVEAMVGFGIRHDEISRLIINPRTGKPIDEKTLRLRFRTELDTGVTKANVGVASAIYKEAVEKNNVTAMIWWTKARMGWKERTDVNLSGTIGQTVRFVVDGAPPMKTIEAVAEPT
jgi:hypothetical protein